MHLKLQAQGAESGSAETTVVSVSADKFRVLLTGLFCYVLHELFLNIFCFYKFELNLMCVSVSLSIELKQAQAMMNALQ